jgi:hypothetical protein
MATTTGNPWISTTAETITTKPTRVNYMAYTPTTDGDDLSVTDNGGNVLWAMKAIAADSNQGIEYTKTFETSVNGIIVGTIDHGTLNVYLS